MKITGQILALTLLFGTQVDGQNNVYDTTDKHYTGIDFRFKDDLNYWTYQFKKRKATKKNLAIGHISLWRTEKWDDNKDKEFHPSWNPGISFDIFNLKDSIAALELSKTMRSLTICETPQIGGDIFVVGSFVFVNSEPCVSCYRKLTNEEYCRPTINFLFSGINISKFSTLKDLINQLPIKENTE